MVDAVQTIVTPGECVDVLVTERGVAINPLRIDLMEQLTESGVPIVSIDSLLTQVKDIVGEPKPIAYRDQVVGIVEYRDGSLMDIIKAVQA